jgi:hypothetical protein
MSELQMGRGPDGRFHSIGTVREWTLTIRGTTGHSVLHRDERGIEAWGHDPEITALAEAIARQRCRDQARPQPEEPQS